MKTTTITILLLLLIIPSVHAMNWTDYPTDSMLCKGAVDCHNKDIINLANKLKADTPEETVKNNIKWIYQNIEYDESIIKPANVLFNFMFKKNTYYKKASDVLKERKGICNHKALLFTAISKAQGLSVRSYTACVKDSCNFKNKYICAIEKKLLHCSMKHTYNKVWLNGEWIFVDATSGEYKYHHFNNYDDERRCNPYPLSFQRGDCVCHSWVNYG